MRVRRILLDEHEERVRRDKCPKCNKFSLQRLEVKNQKILPKSKYKFIDYFWACSSPESFNCYFISSTLGDTIFESSEGVSIVDFNETKTPEYKGAKVVKRLKSGQVINIIPLGFSH